MKLGEACPVTGSLSLVRRALNFSPRMRPDAALEAQLARYRAMTREERVGIALGLHELACEMSRLGIRRRHPTASPAEVEQRLRERLELARDL
jgi:hypothetical protein